MAHCPMLDKSISTDFSLPLENDFSAYKDVDLVLLRRQSKQF